MAKLTAKQEAFVAMMAQNAELAQRGFDLLLKRPAFEEFFDPLEKAGFFQPQRNPAPVPSSEEGYFRVLYWEALDYLVAVARVSGETNDLDLAEKVMNVVRSVTTYRDARGEPTRNYNTARKLAELIGLLPLAAVTENDLDLIPEWLAGPFDRGRMVGHALDEGFVGRALQSDNLADRVKAVAVLRHCTAIQEEEAPLGGTKPRMAVDDWSIQELVRHHAPDYGTRVGAQAASLLRLRVREVFASSNRGRSSRRYRPAVEEHEQNHSWWAVVNIAVAGLRDVVLNWNDSEPAAARDFVRDLLQDNEEILRRIGLYVLDQRWEGLRGLYLEFVGPYLFAWGHLHEFYNLLRRHFAEFTEGEKTATMQAIQQLPLEDGVAPRRTQRWWLSALAQKGYEPADRWLSELESDPGIGRLTDHPDFDVYIEPGFVPEAAPYAREEILAFARDGSLIERLNAFTEPNSWRGPTTRSLADVLEQAVVADPTHFLKLLPQFLQAKRAFQYGVLSGLKQAWEAAAEKPGEMDWALAWDSLMGFSEHLVADQGLWSEIGETGPGPTPTSAWIPPLLAELLKAGVRNDAYAYPPPLLSRGWALIVILLEGCAPVESPVEDDPMMQAINAPKGKAIEALVVHALRVCRLADAAQGQHTDAWAVMEPTFDAELAKCANANYEFSTLCGVYAANLDYLSPQWFAGSVKKIFPEAYPANVKCAIAGLAYAPTTRRVYALLRDAGVVDWALRADLRAEYAREKLIERLTLAYLWGEEPLDSPRWSYIIEKGLRKDLIQATRFLWSVRGGHFAREHRERVVQFFERCVAWGQDLAAPPADVFGALATLAGFLQAIEGNERALLEVVAPFVHAEHGTHEFLGELQRLVDVSPHGVSAVLERLLSTQVPSYDYEDRLKKLIGSLAERGLKENAITHANRARSVRGMQELYDQLTVKNTS